MLPLLCTSACTTLAILAASLVTLSSSYPTATRVRGGHFASLHARPSSFPTLASLTKQEAAFTEGLRQLEALLAARDRQQREHREEEVVRAEEEEGGVQQQRFGGESPHPDSMDYWQQRRQQANAKYREGVEGAAANSDEIVFKIKRNAASGGRKGLGQDDVLFALWNRYMEKKRGLYR